MCIIPRLRGIPEAYSWLIDQDPESKITLRCFRALVSQGTVKSVHRGRKILINLDTLPEDIQAWVNSGMEINPPERTRERKAAAFPKVEFQKTVLKDIRSNQCQVAVLI